MTDGSELANGLDDTAMTIDQVINLLASLTLFEMMVSIGLGVSFAELVGVARNWSLVGRALVANFIGVPLVVVGLLLLFRAESFVAVGFLIAAVCPGAPYGPPLTGLARGNVIAAVGLMVILAGSSALIAPLILSFLLPLMGGDQPLEVDAVKMVITLLLAQFLPLCLGLAVRHWRPLLAEKLKMPANVLSLGLNLATLGVVLIAQFNMLVGIPLRGYAGMFALLIASLGIGWLMGGSGSGHRKTLSLATAVRNAGVSLVIASGSFPGTPAVTAAMAYALFQTILAALIALAWGRLTPSEPTGAQAQQPPIGSIEMGEHGE